MLIYGCDSFNSIAADGTVQNAKTAIDKGADVNAPEKGTGMTPLMSAIRYNKNPFEMTQFLLQSGANIQAADNTGMTALHFAAGAINAEGSYRTTQVLLKSGANVNSRGADNLTPLHIAAGAKKHIRTVKLLIEHGSDIKAQDLRGETPLHRAACANENAEIIKYLLSKGADINAGAPDPDHTPLHKAVFCNAADNIKPLLDAGADKNCRGQLSESKTPLELAIDANSFEIARQLIENGANINTETYYIFKPFKYRDYKQSWARKLVHVDVSQINSEKMTPLHRAVTHNNIKLVKLLLSKNANPNIDAHFGGYALDFAVYLEYYDIAELIMKAGGNMIFKDTYLNDAIDKENMKMAEFLLKGGADPNFRSSYGNYTPLHFASQDSKPGFVRVLLKYGADPELKTNEGKTAIDLASSDAIREILLHYKKKK